LEVANKIFKIHVYTIVFERARLVIYKCSTY